MKNFFFLILSLTFTSTTQAQKLAGLWYSEDSTRLYEIQQTGDNKYRAIIKSSARKGDSIGYVVIKNLQYNARKKRFEGIIYAVSDNQPAFFKIKFNKNPDRIILKLSRMFIMDVSINWIKAIS